MKTTQKYDTKKILISIAKKQDGMINIHGLRDFMRFLSNKLSGRGQDKYLITYDLNEEGIEKVVANNKDIFRMSPRRDILIINKDHSDCKNSDVDNELDRIIDEYFN